MTRNIAVYCTEGMLKLPVAKSNLFSKSLKPRNTQIDSMVLAMRTNTYVELAMRKDTMES